MGSRLEGQIKESTAASDRRLLKLETQFAEMQSAYAALNRTLVAGAIVLFAALIGVIGALLA